MQHILLDHHCLITTILPKDKVSDRYLDHLYGHTTSPGTFYILYVCTIHP